MAFSESLTVRILGDSSELQRELDSVLERFDDLKEKVSEASNSVRQLTSSFRRLSQAVAPLQQVSNLVVKLGQQLRSLSQRPITLNVGPALQSLQQLTNAARQAASAIQSIPAMPTLGPIGGGGPLPAGGGGSPRQFAGGGLVAGPSGIDQVPAQLTAGEFVVNRSAVESIGLGFLENINSNPLKVAPLARISDKNGRVRQADASAPRPAKSTKLAKPAMSVVSSLQANQAAHNIDSTLRHMVKPSSQSSSMHMTSQTQHTNNHFGGITIHVANAGETDALVRDLELQGIGRRIRRG